MSYSDYWDGDCEMAKYYRDKYEYDREQANYDLWLQGAYIYDALLGASPMFRDWSKRTKPYPYRDTPAPITQREIKHKTELDQKKLLENSKNAMRAMMIHWNQKFAEKGGKPNGDST